MTRRWHKEPFLVALVVIGPFALALLAYFGWADLHQVAQVPNPDRELLSTPISLPLIALQGPTGESTQPDWARYRWSLIYAKMTPCTDDCALHLERLTQVFLALGRDRERMQRVFLTTRDNVALAVDPSLLTGVLDAERDVALVQAFGRERLDAGRFFVVDPLGNLILSYPPEADQRRLLEDLERLLDVSRIG